MRPQTENAVKKSLKENVCASSSHKKYRNPGHAHDTVLIWNEIPGVVTIWEVVLVRHRRVSERLPQYLTSGDWTCASFNGFRLIHIVCRHTKEDPEQFTD
jgi:hypothetical protein